jgi:hypothetical protein
MAAVRGRELNGKAWRGIAGKARQGRERSGLAGLGWVRQAR